MGTKGHGGGGRAPQPLRIIFPKESRRFSVVLTFLLYAAGTLRHNRMGSSLRAWLQLDTTREAQDMKAADYLDTVSVHVITWS